MSGSPEIHSHSYASGTPDSLDDQDALAQSESPKLSVHDLHKAYVSRKERVEVLSGLDLSVASGEFVSLLGPSGCGKTTTLNLIAGFIRADSGRILLDGADITGVPPHRRNISLVFQNYSLFPHMTVEENVNFGLRMNKRDLGWSKTDIRERVTYALELVDLPQVADRYPGELSGGQQQRVGLARALAVNPSVLLLDEPLSNLDAPLRKAMQVQLRRIIDEVDITTVYVTHDQEEALALSDRIIVMNQGAIEQAGTPRDVYERPASSYVAGFVGESNFIDVTVDRGHDSSTGVRTSTGVFITVDDVPADVQSGDPMQLVFRPENVTVRNASSRTGADPGVAANDPIAGVVRTHSYLGSGLKILVDAGDDGELFALAPASAGDTYPIGSSVELELDTAACFLLPKAAD